MVNKSGSLFCIDFYYISNLNYYSFYRKYFSKNRDGVIILCSAVYESENATGVTVQNSDHHKIRIYVCSCFILQLPLLVSAVVDNAVWQIMVSNKKVFDKILFFTIKLHYIYEILAVCACNFVCVEFIKNLLQLLNKFLK